MRVRLESGDEPGYEPRLLVSSHLRGQEVAVVVSDKGTGIIVDVTGRTNCRLSPLAIFERKGGVRRDFRVSPGLIRHGDPARIPENPWFCPIFAVSAHLDDGDGGQHYPAVIARTLTA